MSWMPSHSNPNLLHNATYVIDQANEGAAVSISGIGNNSFGPDLWEGYIFSGQGATATIGRVAANSVASGCPFKYAIQYTCTALQTEVGGPYTGVAANIHTILENGAVQGLMWGSGQGVYLTISFWALSNNTGVYDFNIWNQNSGGSSWNYTVNFTISTANTWKKYVFVIPSPPQNSGWIDTTTGNPYALQCRWSLFAASNYFSTGVTNTWVNSTAYASTNQSNTFLFTVGNLFQLAGAKLEYGYSPTSLIVPSMVEELKICQRYYEKSWAPGTAVGTVTTTNAITILNDAIVISGGAVSLGGVYYKAYKIKTPTITIYSPNSGTSGKTYNISAAADETSTLVWSANTVFGISTPNPSSAAIDFMFHYTADARINA